MTTAIIQYGHGILETGEDLFQAIEFYNINVQADERIEYSEIECMDYAGTDLVEGKLYYTVDPELIESHRG